MKSCDVNLDFMRDFESKVSRCYFLKKKEAGRLLFFYALMEPVELEIASWLIEDAEWACNGVVPSHTPTLEILGDESLFALATYRDHFKGQISLTQYLIDVSVLWQAVGFKSFGKRLLKKALP